MKTLLKLAVAVTATGLLTTGVMAQDTTRKGGGNGGKWWGTGQAGGNKGGGGGGGGTTAGTKPTTPTTPTAPATPTTPTPPATPPVTSNPNNYGFGYGGGWNGIDRRQAAQGYEIERGRRNGTLTGREYDQLRAEQARIDDLERRAKGDGVVTREERRQIRDAQRDAQRHIYEETHDREGRRYGWGWGYGWGRRGWW